MAFSVYPVSSAEKTSIPTTIWDATRLVAYINTSRAILQGNRLRSQETRCALPYNAAGIVYTKPGCRHDIAHPCGKAQV